jgi:hypothetical protein
MIIMLVPEIGAIIIQVVNMKISRLMMITNVLMITVVSILEYIMTKSLPLAMMLVVLLFAILKMDGLPYL